MGCEVLVASARSTGKLNDESLTHEIGTILDWLGVCQRSRYLDIRTESYGQSQYV